MTAAPALWAVGQDVVWCLGLGLLLAVGRDFLGLLAGNGRILSFVWDVLAFAAASVLLCGFTASASAGGVARWYMAAALGAGALSWHWAVSGLLHCLAETVTGALAAVAMRMRCLVSAPFARLWYRHAVKKQEKKAIKAKNTPEKVTKRKKRLQKQRKILYN